MGTNDYMRHCLYCGAQAFHPNGASYCAECAHYGRTTPRAYVHALGILNGRRTRTLAGDTYATAHDDGRITVTYRGTDVVTFLPDGAVRMDNGGWPTMTPKRRMSDAISGAFSVALGGYVLRHGSLPKSAAKNPWRLAGKPFDVAGESDVYVMTPWNSYFEVSPVTGAPGWGSNDGTAPRLVVELSADELAPFATDGTEYRRELGTYGAGRPLCPACGQRDATVSYRWVANNPSVMSCDTCAGVATRRAS